jgi:hypothetical protein
MAPFGNEDGCYLQGDVFHNLFHPVFELIIFDLSNSYDTSSQLITQLSNESTFKRKKSSKFIFKHVYRRKICTFGFWIV